jgi:hypothetical protein
MLFGLATAPYISSLGINLETGQQVRSQYFNHKKQTIRYNIVTALLNMRENNIVTALLNMRVSSVILGFPVIKIVLLFY